jgi:hypothetical protein
MFAIVAALGVPRASHADPDRFQPFAQPPRTHHVDCDRGETITRTLDFIRPGDTVLVSGTCSENLLLSNTVHQFDGITLDGQGTATLLGPVATSNVIELVGVNTFTIQNLTITGGYDGISVNTSLRVAISNVTVNRAGRIGVHYQRMSQGYVVNSTLENNPSNGLVVNENSYVRVGETDGVGATEGDLGPCTIASNGGYGIRVQRQSKARIYVSSIEDNVNDGVHVESESYAEIATDDISGNKNGVFVSENGVIHLGNPTGTTAEDNPNTTHGAPNTQFGLSASQTADVLGRLGTLSGVKGASTFTTGAQDNLTP